MAEPKAERVFDAYEITAIIVPGASLLLGLWLLDRGVLPAALEPKDVSLGAFGLFVLAAFCVGHIVQAPANAIVDLSWRIFGRPTEKMRRKGCGLADEQVDRIPGQVSAVLKIGVSLDEPDSQWRPVTAQMAVAVANAGRDARLQKFNGNYGLFRGLAMSLVLICIAATLQRQWPAAALALAAAWAVRFRMKRFSGHYARELWLQFLAMAGDDKAVASGAAT